MKKIEKREFLYEVQEFKIKNPNEQEREEIYKLIEKCRDDKNTDELNDQVLILELCKMLIEPSDDKYDFNNYIFIEFEDMLNNPEQYSYFNDILYVIKNLIADISIEFLKEQIMMIKKLELVKLNEQYLLEINKVQKIHNQLQRDYNVENNKKNSKELKPLPKLNRGERRELDKKYKNNK